jgi:hypothetical protein
MLHSLLSSPPGLDYDLKQGHSMMHGPCIVRSPIKAAGLARCGSFQSVMLDQFRGAEKNVKFVCLVVSYVLLLLGCHKSCCC